MFHYAISHVSRLPNDESIPSRQGLLTNSLHDCIVPSACHQGGNVTPSAGDRFLGLSSSTPPGASPALSSFWPNLQQHLTDLELLLYPGKGEAQHLGALGLLTALERLEVDRRLPWLLEGRCQHRNMAGEKVTLKLPNLHRLMLGYLEQGELVLSCPKLTQAWFTDFNRMRIVVEGAPSTWMVLADCKELQFERKFNSSIVELENLKRLSVIGCKEVGRFLIKDVGQMKDLHNLAYREIPAACMPRSFPLSIRDLELCSIDWCLDLPEGLKELHNLTSMFFDSKHQSWEITRPLADLLPLAGIRELGLGEPHLYRREGGGPLKHIFLEFVTDSSRPRITGQRYQDDLAP